MKHLFPRLDRLRCFQPSRWPYGEVISRVTALVIIVGLLVLRMERFERFPQTWQAAYTFFKGICDSSGHAVYSTADIAVAWAVRLAVWVMETAIYVGYVVSYASRAKAVDKARGIMETAFPVFVAGLPLLIPLAPYTLPQWVPVSSQAYLQVHIAVMLVILAGGAINLAGLLYLRRAFAIMAEARELVTIGIFRYVRHPLYSGHFILFFGSLILRLHWYTVAVYLLFCAGQVYRARIEEAKLAAIFPEYRDYAKKTGMFFPFPGKQQGRQ